MNSQVRARNKEGKGKNDDTIGHYLGRLICRDSCSKVPYQIEDIASMPVVQIRKMGDNVAIDFYNSKIVVIFICMRDNVSVKD